MNAPAPADEGAPMAGGDEARAVVSRYARRHDGDRYSFLRPEVWLGVHERQRAMLRLFEDLGLRDLAALRCVEVGCGGGGNLLELLRIGFVPEHLAGIELLPERHARARHVLPSAVQLTLGDAGATELPPASHDIVYVSTVFSSLLDPAFQQRLAARMWSWVRPGGGVLWYDFTVDNPRNRDVRGVPAARVRALFPEGTLRLRRVTLAPPLARAATRVHPSLYTVLNVLPPLRTHLLAWIGKRVSAANESSRG
jgi:SAM-dependent methyltransferase